MAPLTFRLTSSQLVNASTSLVDMGSTRGFPISTMQDCRCLMAVLYVLQVFRAREWLAVSAKSAFVLSGTSRLWKE